MQKLLSYFIVIYFSFCTSGCVTASSPTDLPIFTESPKLSDSIVPAIEVTYTGTAGALLRLDQHAVMLDPYLSNLNGSIFDLFSRPETDKKTVDALLPDVSMVSGILIGHAHIDHLLDAPYVLSHASAHAKIYGSDTTFNIIAPLVPENRREALNDVMATDNHLGRWITLPDPYIRVMAIKSEHAPQLGPLLFGSGEVDKVQEKIPRALGWKVGQPLTYLVDFLKTPINGPSDKAEILYRVFLQSSSSGPGLGIPPAELIDEHPVDLALLCVASFNNVDNYPEHIIKRIQPANVVLLHWDNFMLPRLEHDVELFPLLGADDINEFIERAQSAMGHKGQVLMPNPGVSFLLPISG